MGIGWLVPRRPPAQPKTVCASAQPGKVVNACHCKGMELYGRMVYGVNNEYLIHCKQVVSDLSVFSLCNMGLVDLLGEWLTKEIQSNCLCCLLCLHMHSQKLQVRTDTISSFTTSCGIQSFGVNLKCFQHVVATVWR